MGGNDWKWLEGLELLDLARNGWNGLKWQDMAGNFQCLEMAGIAENCWKCLDIAGMAGHGWTWLEMTGMTGNSWK